jgi:hypothetical protein
MAPFNAAVVYPGFLSDPCNGAELHWVEEGRAPGADTRIFAAPLDLTEVWLTHPACVLRHGTGRWGSEAPGAADVESALPHLARVRYVLVPRLRFGRPTYNIEADGAVRTFNPGSIVGDALLYDLTSGAHLGGFKVEVTNADQVESQASAFAALQSDLTERARALMKERVVALAPGAIEPP